MPQLTCRGALLYTNGHAHDGCSDGQTPKREHTTELKFLGVGQSEPPDLHYDLVS